MPLLTSTARYMVAFMVGVIILQEIGIDIRAVLVSAGVVGVAIGLGAQSLIRDVILGFFILLENLIAVGDVIEVGQHTGVVEAVGLRVTKIRKFSGELRIIPNGELTAFGHHSAGWARLVVEVSIDYDEDVDHALRVLGEAGKSLAAAHPRWSSSRRPRRASCGSVRAARPRRSCACTPAWWRSRRPRSSSRPAGA